MSKVFMKQLRKASVFFAALAAVGVAQAAAGPRVLLDDAFIDGERGTQNLPASAEWFTSSAASTVDVVSGAGLTQRGGGRHVIAYFTPALEPVRLVPGQTLKLTYQVAVHGPMDGPGAFRVGLFNSGGARVVGDKQSRSHDFVGYRGYIGTTNPMPMKNAPLRLAKRTGEYDTLLAEIGAYSLLGGVGGSLQTMRDGELHTGTLAITCVSYDQAVIAHGYEGGALREMFVSEADNSGPVFDFDTVVIHAGSKAADGFTLRSVRVEVLNE